MFRKSPVTFIGILFLSAFAYTNNNPREMVLYEIAITTERSINEGTVLGASRLKNGQTVTEAEIVAAVARINRLEFVLQVDYRIVLLEENEVRLEIDVVARRPYDVRIASNWFRSDNYSGSLQRDSISLNGRLFLEGAQMLTLAVSPSWAWGGDNSNGGNVALAYDHFDLFKRGVQLHASIRHYEDTDYRFSFLNSGNTEYDPSFHLRLLVPLAGDHVIWFSGEKEGSLLDETLNVSTGPIIADDFRTIQNSVNRDRETWRLGYQLNTLDSDFAPRRGLLFETVYTYSEEDAEYRQEEPDLGRTYFFESQNESHRLHAEIRQHRELSRSRSWFYGGSFTWSDSDAFFPSYVISDGGDSTRVQLFQMEQERYRAFAGHGWDLFRRGNLSRFGGLRLDLLGSVYYDTFDRLVRPEDTVSLPFQDNHTLYELESNLSYRTDWGTFGLTLSYEIDP